MKTTIKITAIMLLSVLAFSSLLKADEINLPVINKPAVLEEGTQRELTAAQIAELLPWAKDSKIFLVDLLDNIQGLSTTDKIDTLVEGLKSVVGESAPKNSELLMRYALNRGLAINDIITRETSDTAVGTADAKLRVLRSSIQMAIKYYDSDMAVLARKSTAPYVIFGLDYFEFLSELNKSVFDASAQYAIQRSALEWLQWDLYRDLNNASYASQIVKINNSLKTFPNRRLSDAQSIASIRQMKSVALQLKVRETLKKLELDKAMAEARTEAERQTILRKRQEEDDRLEREKQAGIDSNNSGTVTRSTVDATINKGDLVIYGSSLRIVEFIADNGQVALKEDSNYNRLITSKASIQKAISSYGNFSTNSYVIYGNSIRVLEWLTPVGGAVLKDDNNYNRTFITAANISRTVQAFGKYRVGDKVIHGSTVRVIEFLDDKGRVVLKDDSNYNRTFVTATDVSRIL
jgi:biotin carboxyl carrier protein